MSCRLEDRREGGIELEAFGSARRFAQPISFTPFASASPCSARCVFCSETLLYRDRTGMTAGLRPTSAYLGGLDAVLGELRTLPKALSLSGLEATDRPEWLLPVLALLQADRAAGGAWTDGVLYTNGNGLATAAGRERLLPALQAAGVERLEWSRHHPDEAANQAIMRFRAGLPIAGQRSFEEAVRACNAVIPVVLSCVVQHGGVATLAGLEDYVALAQRLGARRAIVRELSRLGDLYQESASVRTVRKVRVPLEDLREPVLGSGRWSLVKVCQGYYYESTTYVGQDGFLLTLETSDYVRMKQQHAAATIRKLVYHANGNLTADWDPATHILYAHAQPL